MFHDQWTELITWLDSNTEKQDNQKSLASDPDKIKEHIQKHNAFQRTLGAKQTAFDSVCRNGRHLKERAPKPDTPRLDEMLGEVKSKWHNLCGKSVDR